MRVPEKEVISVLVRHILWKRREKNEEEGWLEEEMKRKGLKKDAILWTLEQRIFDDAIIYVELVDRSI